MDNDWLVERLANLITDAQSGERVDAATQASEIREYMSVDCQRRYESLMDELVKLANRFEGYVQIERDFLPIAPDRASAEYARGNGNGYSVALHMLQEVMRNA